MTYEETFMPLIAYIRIHKEQEYMQIKMKEDDWEKVANALEKQIRKKPNYYYNSFADGNPVWECSCPNCGTDLEESDHHCICGQHIDWSEENE